VSGAPSAHAGSSAPDAELIGRVLAGERELYRVLVQRHRPALFRVAYTMVLDRDIAEDMVQDTFVRAYVNLARCRNRAGFRFWLLSTLRNRTIDHLKEKRRQDVSMSDEKVLRKVELRTAAEPRQEVDLRSALDGVLERLSLPLREAFVLRHLEDCSFEELAGLLEITVSAAKMRVHRAREQLLEWLGPDPRAGAENTEVTEGEGTIVLSKGRGAIGGPRLWKLQGGRQQ
jgi:RNA polymerase sigma-70 factor (ECF subfamily)